MSRYQSFELFYKILPHLKIDEILEVGSRDGLDLIKMAKSSLASKLYCFEANPENISIIEGNLKERNVEAHIVNTIVSSSEKEIEFYIYDKPGLGTIKKRLEKEPTKIISIKSTSLDNFFKGNENSSRVMWMDVEGAAYEVLYASKAILPEVAMIYTEVEVEDVFKNTYQRTDLIKFLRGFGFKEIQFSPHNKVDGKVKVGDSLFVNRKFINSPISKIIRSHLWQSRKIETKIWLYENLLAHLKRK